jgi:hypothetical protein
MVLSLVEGAAAETSPLWVPVAAGVGGALLGGAGALLLSKKDASIANSNSQQNVYHAPMENYQPNIQYAPVTSYAYQGATTIINSPNATAGKLSQATTSDPTANPSYTTPQTYSPSNATGSGAGSLLGNVDLTTLAIIGAIAVVGYAIFRKK